MSDRGSKTAYSLVWKAWEDSSLVRGSFFGDCFGDGAQGPGSGEGLVWEIGAGLSAGVQNEPHALCIVQCVWGSFALSEVQLCATCQKMVRSETGAAGVMFSLDTESGFKDVVFVTSAWGLGETVVGGTVNPDEWYPKRYESETGFLSVILQP